MTALSTDFRKLLWKIKIKDRFGRKLEEGFPTKELLFARNPPELIGNKVTGSYDSVSEYVNIQYDLLLEDFMRPLRDALRNFNHKRKIFGMKGVCVFLKVGLENIDRKEKTCKIENKKELNRQGHFTFGRLLLFTRRNFHDNFFLAIVTSQENTTGADSSDITLAWHIPQKSVLKVEDLEKGSFTVIEAEAFYFVYQKVLTVLGQLNEKVFPMSKYIVYGSNQTHVSHPEYLTESTRYKILFCEHVPVLDHSKWPSLANMDLDESQSIALKRALTEEVAVIQGPPGTGKTYFGVKLVQVLLDNIHIWNPTGRTPLQVVCQSNLAVDNFLEGILKYSDKIVRIGNRGSSQKLKPFNLQELVCRWLVKTFPDLYCLIDSHLKTLDKARRQFQELSKGIVSFKTFKYYNIVNKNATSVLECEEKFLEWLGLHIKARKKCIPEQGTDLVVSIDEFSQQIYQLVLAGEHLLAAKLKEDLSKIEKLIARFTESFKLKFICNVDDIACLSSNDACEVYLYWLCKFSSYLHNKIEGLEEDFKILWNDAIPKDMKDLGTIEVLSSSQVLGLTSTGAAARQHTLLRLGVPIVIVDEAAELLESHVVVSMTKNCEHLILLGDHKQLKPSVTSHQLGNDYHLDMSLFERLLRNRVITATCLTTQYRMRPEFSALLKPHIYEVLNNGPGTKGRTPVRGMSQNLYFLDHKKLELNTDDLLGTWNPHEVEMLIKLAEYLVSVGYATTDITIVAMYNEQKKKLIEAQGKSSLLTNLEIASVDSFQGKENEIILLSLVRSNKTGNIGFLKQEGRVCVALSRARSGFFIMGNMNCLTKRCNLWKLVSEVLKKQNAIGKKLTLVCKRHKTVHHVSEMKDWRPANICRLCYKEVEKEREKNKRVERSGSRGIAINKTTKNLQAMKGTNKKNPGDRKGSKGTLVGITSKDLQEMETAKKKKAVLGKWSRKTMVNRRWKDLQIEETKRNKRSIMVYRPTATKDLQEIKEIRKSNLVDGQGSKKTVVAAPTATKGLQEIKATRKNRTSGKE